MLIYQLLKVAQILAASPVGLVQNQEGAAPHVCLSALHEILKFKQ